MVPGSGRLPASAPTLSCQALDDRLCTALRLDVAEWSLRTLEKRVFLNRSPGFESLLLRKRNKAVQVEREEPSYRRIVNDYISS
jgi:hypothetical protein